MRVKQLDSKEIKDFNKKVKKNKNEKSTQIVILTVDSFGKLKKRLKKLIIHRRNSEKEWETKPEGSC